MTILNLIEIGLVVFLLITALRVMFRPFAVNVVHVISIIAAAAAGALFHFLVAALFVPDITKNPIAGWLTVIFLDALVFLAVSQTLIFSLRWKLKRAKKNGESPSVRRRSALGFVLNLALLSVFCCFISLALMVVMSIAGMSPMAENLRRDSVFLKYFMLSPGDRLGMKESDQGGRFFRRLSDLAQGAKEAVAEKTGIKSALDQLSILVELLNLPPEEAGWLIDNTPELRRLKDNPRLKEVMEDEEIMTLLAEVSGGSAGAVLKMGDIPSIQRLAEDKEVAGAIRALDLESLGARSQEHRQSVYRQNAFSVEWRVSQMETSIHFESALSESDTWTVSRTPNGILSWGNDVKFGVMKTNLRAEEEMKMLVILETEGDPVLWVNGERVRLRRSDSGYRAGTRLREVNVEIAVMIDFTACSGPRTCRALVVQI